PRARGNSIRCAESWATSATRRPRPSSSKVSSVSNTGYDSAGVAVVDGGRLDVRRSAGKIAKLEHALLEDPLPRARIAIGHTRWATHGAPSDANAHPHTDCTRASAVVHDGIIENQAELRLQLKKISYIHAEGYPAGEMKHGPIELIDGSLPD